ncbi:MAG: hypothetical protein ACXIUW_05035 [Roseinatronobacter sp.]
MRLIGPPNSGQDREDTDYDAALDWLECVAMCDQAGRAQLRKLIDHFRVEDETAEPDQIDDTSREDAELAQIEVLFNQRVKALSDAYPFELSENGSELVFLSNPLTVPAQAYIMCLLVSANRRLPGGWHSELDNLKVRLTQRVIQLVATIAMAGVARGPSVSVGWPREADPTIVSVLNRAAQMGSCVVPNTQPNLQVARPTDKDAGVDVLAWEQVTPPQVTPGFVWLGQVASGSNWPNKSVLQDKDVFKEGYVYSSGTPNWNGATIIPFARNGDELQRSREDFRHGKVLDRHSLPKYFSDGLDLHAAGVPMDGISNLADLYQWNAEMIAKIK